MSAPTLRKLVSLLCVLASLIPLAGLFSEAHDCACGMSRDACLCALTAMKSGAHCEMGIASSKGKCSMGPLRSSSPAALIASFDLHGWLPPRADVLPAPAPAGTAPLLVLRAPRFVPCSPEPPPPWPSTFA